MIPGFVSVYKSKNDGLPHIYFYPGYDDYDRNIYRKLQESLMTAGFSSKRILEIRDKKF